MGQPAPSPAKPGAGRASNPGLESLSLSPEGKTLFGALQSAARQGLGAPAAATRDTASLSTHDASAPDDIQLSGESVVTLPMFRQGASTLVAAQRAAAGLARQAAPGADQTR